MGFQMEERGLAGLLDELSGRAECRFDPELHTGPDVFEAESRGAREAREDAAKEVCEGCAVWAVCLEYALRTRPTHGVWAGLTVSELGRLRKAARGSAIGEAA